ncbi:hypothetical protein [Ruminiclostridium cellobioparum]|uniref:Uncharacterized protein n=1 Tax=Ruminiclostridium cellobioparum subsp. termitidis CT1112 TaxID=1195236 RepID=S0FXT6_RUMCE|nr:hypothetical protein [Ruminiclostridium cellobioparum]EMS73378.1 hypothetical protein CTER_0596 [Ruminiclostridium cellobioparum subsp. termitidis CT1112]
MQDYTNNFVGYEYKDVTVKRNMETVYADGYTNFGWTLESTSTSIQSAGTVTLKFKRDRGIRTKAELTRLQRQFDSCISEIQRLEFSKILQASAVAYVVGVIGTAFMAGSVFANLAGMIPLSVLLAIPGFSGWIIPYLCYRSISTKKSEEVTPLIDKKYDEIYEVCEKANSMLNN